MTIKATVIGQKPVELQPTRLDGSVGGAASPRPESLSSMRPTSIQPTPVTGESLQPTKLPGTTAPAVTLKPTSLSAMPPAAEKPAERPLTASALPGERRTVVDVSLDNLVRRFPTESPDMLTRVKSILAGASPASMDAPAWLAFGRSAQESQATLVKDRLTLMESSPTREVSQHLARLNSLLQEVLDALDGGFLKKPAIKVWESVSGEVRQLESLLLAANGLLAGMLGHLVELSSKNKESGEVLQANFLAGEYLLDLVDAKIGDLLLPRLTAITASQALVREQLQEIALGQSRVEELTTLVQNGVLVQLPAVYSQMAGLTGKPSDTQRFLVTEKLAEITQSIKRKL